MRSDIQVQTEQGEVVIAKWLPETPLPPPAVVAFFTAEPPETIDALAIALTESGYVVTQMIPSHDYDLSYLHSQFLEINNRYLAVPFYAAGYGENAGLLSDYCRRYPDDFHGMIWLKHRLYHDPEFDPIPSDKGIGKRLIHWVNTEILSGNEILSELPKIPLAIFTDDLPEVADTLSKMENHAEMILHIFPNLTTENPKSWFTRSLVRQLDSWHAEWVEILEKLKRGALKWDREKTQY